MIALVRIALRRPYTFVVLALTILIIGPLAALRTPVDIFPDIRIPVIAIIWGYTGLQPDLMAGRIVTQSQRGLTTTVNDIEHIEATSYNGLGIIKVFFHPNVDIRIAKQIGERIARCRVGGRTVITGDRDVKRIFGEARDLENPREPVRRNIPIGLSIGPRTRALTRSVHCVRVDRTDERPVRSVEPDLRPVLAVGLDMKPPRTFGLDWMDLLGLAFEIEKS